MGGRKGNKEVLPAFWNPGHRSSKSLYSSDRLNAELIGVSKICPQFYIITFTKSIFSTVIKKSTEAISYTGQQSLIANPIINYISHLKHMQDSSVIINFGTKRSDGLTECKTMKISSQDEESYGKQIDIQVGVGSTLHFIIYRVIQRVPLFGNISQCSDAFIQQIICKTMCKNQFEIRH